VDEYLALHPGALAEAAEKLDPAYEMKELIGLLPGFWEFMLSKDPDLHERPTGMY
jgi:hypothetical protein